MGGSSSKNKSYGADAILAALTKSLTPTPKQLKAGGNAGLPVPALISIIASYATPRMVATIAGDPNPHVKTGREKIDSPVGMCWYSSGDAGSGDGKTSGGGSGGSGGGGAKLLFAVRNSIKQLDISGQ